MADWFRRKTWTKKDEEEFFAKLGRARKDGRAQYLRVQAIELVETQKTDLLVVAESLLNKVLIEFPDNRLERGSVLNTLGEIYKLRGDFEKAIAFFKEAVDYEEVFPYSQTNAYLEFSALIVKTKNLAQFDVVEALLIRKLPGLRFPIAKYRCFSILAMINHYYGNGDQAKLYAELANECANAKTSGFRYHKDLGLVNVDDGWFDWLLNRK